MKAVKKQLKTICKRLLSICVILMLFIASALPCIAASTECKLTVSLEDDEKKAIDGLTVFICKIADINNTDYYPSEGFENSGISIAAIVNDPSAANAKAIFEFVKEKDIHSLSAISSSGVAEFIAIEQGIWLVYCEDNGAYSFNPYIVFLPYAEDGTLHYEISSAPKTQINTPNNKSIYVVKKWEDKNNAAKKRPNEITVELKQNGIIIDTAILSEDNGWAYTFTELSNDGKYEVAEKTVQDYSVKYSGDSENGFIIINTYNGEKLPQTGQLWWPILIISTAGIAFILLGIIELGTRKNGKKNK